MLRRSLLTMVASFMLVGALFGSTTQGAAAFSANAGSGARVNAAAAAGSCTLSISSPYRWLSYVRADARVTCTATQSYIKIVVALAGPNPGSWTVTCYNKSSCSNYVTRDYYAGYWMTQCSAYAPVWTNGIYRQSSWVYL
jgi:hypothetical protein